MKYFVYLFLITSISCFASYREYNINGFTFLFETITSKQMENAKAIFNGIDYLDFKDLNNCEARAFWIIWELSSKDITSGIISIEGNLINGWTYHVASVVLVEDQEEPVVFDRSIKNKPLKISQWIKRVSRDNNWSAWGGSSNRKEDIMILNHYCSIFENPLNHKIIKSFSDDNLSPHAQRIFQALSKKGKINGEEKQFTCVNQGLDWM